MSKIYQVRGIIDPSAGNCTKFDDIIAWHAEFATKEEATKCCDFINDFYFTDKNCWCEFEIIEIDTDNLDSADKIKQEYLEQEQLNNA